MYSRRWPKQVQWHETILGVRLPRLFAPDRLDAVFGWHKFLTVVTPGRVPPSALFPFSLID
jgi:hypothetical protein